MTLVTCELVGPRPVGFWAKTNPSAETHARSHRHRSVTPAPSSRSRARARTLDAPSLVPASARRGSGSGRIDLAAMAQNYQTQRWSVSADRRSRGRVSGRRQARHSRGSTRCDGRKRSEAPLRPHLAQQHWLHRCALTARRVRIAAMLQHAMSLCQARARAPMMPTMSAVGRAPAAACASPRSHSACRLHGLGDVVFYGTGQAV